MNEVKEHEEQSNQLQSVPSGFPGHHGVRGRSGPRGHRLHEGREGKPSMAKRGKIPVGLQVYSVRKEAEKDLPGVLAKVAKMGYQGVEFAGYYGHDGQGHPQDARRQWPGLLRHAHPNGGPRRRQAGRHLEFNKILGNKYLICPLAGAGRSQSQGDVARIRQAAQRAGGEAQAAGHVGRLSRPPAGLRPGRRHDRLGHHRQQHQQGRHHAARPRATAWTAAATRSSI